MRHVHLLPSEIDHEMDTPLYESLCREWKDAPPVDLLVARYLGVKPHEEATRDPEEIEGILRSFYAQ